MKKSFGLAVVFALFLPVLVHAARPCSEPTKSSNPRVVFAAAAIDVLERHHRFFRSIPKADPEAPGLNLEAIAAFTHEAEPDFNCAVASMKPHLMSNIPAIHDAAAALTTASEDIPRIVLKIVALEVGARDSGDQASIARSLPQAELELAQATMQLMVATTAIEKALTKEKSLDGKDLMLTSSERAALQKQLVEHFGGSISGGYDASLDPAAGSAESLYRFLASSRPRDTKQKRP